MRVPSYDCANSLGIKSAPGFYLWARETIRSGLSISERVENGLRLRRISVSLWVVDAGFVARVPNAPRETCDLDGLTELSDQEGCIVIHP